MDVTRGIHALLAARLDAGVGPSFSYVVQPGLSVDAEHRDMLLALIDRIVERLLAHARPTDRPVVTAFARPPAEGKRRYLFRYENVSMREPFTPVALAELDAEAKRRGMTAEVVDHGPTYGCVEITLPPAPGSAC